MGKTVNPNRKEKNDAKNESGSKVPVKVIEEWYNIHTMQYHPATNTFFPREAMMLKEWSMKEDSLRISDFYDTRGYDTQTFYRWCSQYPEMQTALEFAKRRIGSRRELGALQRKFDATIIQKTLGHYDYVFRQEQERAQQEKLAYAQNAESKIVVIERFPSSTGSQDIEVVTTSKLTPEQVAANIYRNTATDRQIHVNTDIGGYEEE